MKTFIATIVAMAILAAPAHAQMFGGNPSSVTPGNPGDKEETARIEQERAGIEKEYNDTMKRTHSQSAPAKADPWGHIRPSAGADAKR